MNSLSDIFARHAPKYWEIGLPVIPLLPRTKKAFTEAWQQYSTRMVTPEEQQEWLRRYPNYNLGLPLGEQSGLIAVDVDTDDPKVTEILREILPPTPWVRRGKKGAVYIYRWNGHRTFRIRTMQGASVLEVLSSGTQVVLPPSIHPETQMPYVANSDLTLVLDQVQALPKDIENTLRQGLIMAGVELSTRGYTKVTEVISVGSRDTKMTAIAGIMAKGVTRGERTLLESIDEMRAWVENFTEKVAGDSLDPEKAVNKLIEFIIKDIQVGGKQLAVGWDAGLSQEDRERFTDMFGADNESWELSRMMDYLSEEFMKFPDRAKHISERNRAIETVLSKVKSNTKFTPMEEDILFEFICHSTGRLVTKASLRKRLAQLRRGNMLGETHAEIAQMVIEEMQKYGQMKWYNSQFWQWVGAHWEVVPRFRIMSLIATEYGHFPAARRNSDHEGIQKMMQSLLAGDLSTTGLKGLNFANGFLTTDLKLMDHSPEFGCTYVLPYCYQPEKAGMAQRFHSFLYQSWGHAKDFEDRVQALREAIAITLFGVSPRFQKAFCLYGVPHSGKSVTMQIIQSIIPAEASCHVPPWTWSDKFLPTMMDGKLVNFCGELSESETISGDRFKSIIDGESLSGQFKGRDIFVFRPTCAHWFASNHLPRTRDSSGGFSRRWLFLHFDRFVPEKERDPMLANDIAAEEQEEIVAWAVAVMPDLMRRGYLTTPFSSTELLAEMSGMNNSVRAFLTCDMLDIPGIRAENKLNPEFVTEREIYALYLIYCRERGVKPVSTRIFRQRMMEMQQEFGFLIDVRQDGAKEKVNYEGITERRTK